jgi:zinc transporter, ZIP family
MSLTAMRETFTVVLLSLLAGLGTGLGGLIAVSRKPGKRSFGFLMGLTAGVMISLSFLGLVSEAWALSGFWTATIGFGAGACFMLVIDVSVPHVRFGESESRDIEAPGEPEADIGTRPGRHRHGYRRGVARHLDQQLFMTGVLLAIGITIHNLPEGIAVGAGYMHTPNFGLFIAVAILLHNIPEGIATALPLFTSGVSKWDSFKAALLSGLVEPIGALAAALFLSSFRDLVPGALAFAGGVMMFITLDELIPAARAYGHQHYTAVGIILGSILVLMLSGLFGI